MNKPVPSPRETTEADPLDLDALMAELRAEVAVRQRRAAERDAPGAATRGRVRARDLLGLPEAQFVQAAYVAILGREASPEEVSRNIDRLLLGKASRAAFLRDLAQSNEGRLRGAKVDGLRRALLAERRGPSAVLRLGGSIAHGLRAVYLLPRRIRQFVKRVDALEKRVADLSMRLEAAESRDGQQGALEPAATAPDASTR